MAKQKLFKILFISISVLHVLAIFLSFEMFRSISKIFIIPLLILIYSVSVSRKNSIYIVALIFSFLGDVFLLFSTELNFMLGLGSFLVTHLLYIWLVIQQLKNVKLKDVLFAVVPFVLVFFGLINLLIDHLNEMLIPVIVYGLTISIFGFLTLLNLRVNNVKSSKWLFAGALLFVVSDSVLAIDKFYETNENYALLIMVTYILAQYFICQFMVNVTNSRKVYVKTI